MNSKISAEIIEIGKRLWNRGFVAANDGNISVRISDNEIYTTVTGVSKGFMNPDDIVVVDKDGKVIEGKGKASSELPMHLEMYNRREDIGAIVHAHPPITTGFAAAGIELDKGILPEVLLTLGRIKLTPYGTTGTDELAKIVGNGIEANNGLLMQNHGAVTVGVDLSQAYYRMETLEHYAKIALVTRVLGRQSVLSEEEINKLIKKGSSSLPDETNEINIEEKTEKILISKNELIELIYNIINQN